MVDALRRLGASALFGSLVVMAGCAALRPEMLTAMPKEGTLQPNQIVLVDDGSCPAGQVKQVVAGSNRTNLSNTHQPGLPRQISCIARP